MVHYVRAQMFDVRLYIYTYVIMRLYSMRSLDRLPSSAYIALVNLGGKAQRAQGLLEGGRMRGHVDKHQTVVEWVLEGKGV